MIGENLNERIDEVPNDLRMMISKIAAMQSCATEPGHILVMTASLKRWIQAGLVKRYGGIPGKYEKDIIELKDLLDAAILDYTNSQENWGEAIIRCNLVADDLIALATDEDLLDYTTIEANMMMVQPVAPDERTVTLDDQRLMPKEFTHAP